MRYLLISLCVFCLLSCKYDCQDAQKTRLWEWHGYGKVQKPDVLTFDEHTVITADCYIIKEQDTLGCIIAGEKRYLTSDQLIEVRHKNGVEIEYISK